MPSDDQLSSFPISRALEYAQRVVITHELLTLGV